MLSIGGEGDSKLVRRINGRSTDRSSFLTARCQNARRVGLPVITVVPCRHLVYEPPTKCLHSRVQCLPQADQMLPYHSRYGEVCLLEVIIARRRKVVTVTDRLLRLGRVIREAQLGLSSTPVKSRCG